jgi:hypothetical protein
MTEGNLEFFANFLGTKQGHIHPNYDRGDKSDWTNLIFLGDLKSKGGLERKPSKEFECIK